MGIASRYLDIYFIEFSNIMFVFYKFVERSHTPLQIALKARN